MRSNCTRSFVICTVAGRILSTVPDTLARGVPLVMVCADVVGAVDVTAGFEPEAVAETVTELEGAASVEVGVDVLVALELLQPIASAAISGKTHAKAVPFLHDGSKLMSISLPSIGSSMNPRSVMAGLAINVQHG